ncbi:MAG: cyclase family protein [Gammaproteobacteria bacterium]
MDIIDISPTLEKNLAVFPGDVPFQLQRSHDMQQQDNFTLSSITTTLHAGAHTDAPCHYHKEGIDMASTSLNPYIGPCQVVDVSAYNTVERLLPQHIAIDTITAPRVLFYTHSFTNPNRWQDDFTALSPELIHQLAEKNVQLVGIDTPSIDPANSKTLDSHQAIYQHHMAILEGITLQDVNPGLYTLVALPLKIAGGDASPVRAILLP